MSIANPSPAEPVSQVRRVPIVECGEGMVDFLQHAPLLVFDRPRFTYRRATVCRISVAEALRQATESLASKGYRIAIIEGWRPLYIQRRMHLGTRARLRELHPDWSETKLVRVANRLTAPMDPKVPPPHSTGGAVDVLLADPSGKVLDHVSPYPLYDVHAAPFAARGLSDEARRHRDLLAESFAPTVLTNYPSEYWHWSYGDQGWAYRGKHPHAVFGSVEPKGWQPNPEDAAEEPLRLLELDSEG